MPQGATGEGKHTGASLFLLRLQSDIGGLNDFLGQLSVLFGECGKGLLCAHHWLKGLNGQKSLIERWVMNCFTERLVQLLHHR